MVDANTLWTRTLRSSTEQEGQPPHDGLPSLAGRPRFTPGAVVIASVATLVVLAVWATSVALS